METFKLQIGCVCLFGKIAIPIALREALTEYLPSSNSASWGMTCMDKHCWWPYMNRELIVK